MATPEETLDRIARSGEAVFAIDGADRIILWNKKCEEFVGKPARSVLGKPCHEVLAGRDVHGNVYCHRNCPVGDQARHRPADPVQNFRLVFPTAGGPKWFHISLFAIPSYHPALTTLVHVLRPSEGPASPLEEHLAGEAKPAAEPLWPMVTKEGEAIDLTPREKEVLRSLSEGLSTAAIARRLFISPVTVRNHVQGILHKMDVHTKLAAVVFAYQHKLL